MPRIGTHLKTRRVGIASAGVLALLGGSLLGGCQSGKKPGTASIEETMLENQELRAQLDRADENLRTALEANRGLNERVQQLTGELDQARRDAEELANRALAAETPFDNIEGITVSRHASDIIVEVAGDVLFDSGQTSLKQSSKATLDQVARVINSTYGSNMIRVAGHTDNDPIKKSPWKTNERLSSERALAVEEYLSQKGVEKERIEVVAYGSAFPRGTKRESRRVEIIVLGAG